MVKSNIVIILECLSEPAWHSKCIADQQETSLFDVPHCDVNTDLDLWDRLNFIIRV